MTTARLLWELFAKDHPNYAVGSYDGKNVSYRPTDELLTEELIQQHLDDKLVLGCYQLLPDSTVRWVAWDVDSLENDTAREYASRILRSLQSMGIPHGVEWSGNKGYHIFIFLSEPMPAAQAKDIAEALRQRLGLPASGKHHVECFPKQPALTPSSPYGNLIKLPLGLHPASSKRSVFVDPAQGWETGELLDPDVVLQTFATPEQLIQAMSVPVESNLASMLAQLWKEGDRHTLALAVSGYLATSGWGMEQTRSLIEEICRMTGDDDLKNRLDCVDDTYQSLAEGKAVVGYSRLREVISPQHLNRLVELVNNIASPSTVHQIDSVRTGGKVPTFLRVRSAERIIWAVLQEEGTPLQTPDQILYWYEDESHSTIPVSSLVWDSIMAERFGINQKESFSVQVMEELRMHFHRDADVVKVHRRSTWDGERLYVHLDGEEVFVLDGTDLMRLEYNGECGYMFQRLGSEPVRFNPLVAPTQNVWDHLVSDLSFSVSQDAPATPDQQRELLKAWVLSFFFPELMPTRPILCCLGAPGSGKTSAMRRLLWVLEDPTADVLEPVNDRPDAIRVSMGYHKFMVLDNLERTATRGMVDILNRASTGSEIEQRKLYTDSEVHRIRPDVYIALTAVNLPFSEETLFSRLLPLEMAQIRNPIPEHLLQSKLRVNRNEVWHSLLLHLNEAVGSIRANPEPVMRNSSRLADYVGFTSQLRNAPHCVDYDILGEGIDNMLRQQAAILKESSPFIEVLEMWIRSRPEEAVKPHTLGEIYSALFPIARSGRMRWTWTSARSLERHVSSLHDVMKSDYGARIGFRTYGGTQVVTYTFDGQIGSRSASQNQQELAGET